MGDIPVNHINDTHLKSMGYILWLFGFTGFLIPSMDRQADLRFRVGPIDYTVAWILLTFLGLFGIHRMYMGKWFTGIIYLLTGGVFGLGYLYDFWTLNDQITLINSSGLKRGPLVG
jgi:TM2 domain-containing membrane protein YozV